MKKLSLLLLFFVMSIFTACQDGHEEIWDAIEDLKGNGNESNDGNGENNELGNGFVYLVTYDVNGGEGVMPVDTFYYATLKAIKYCIFTKEGYYFKEWNTSKDGSGAPFQNVASIVIDRNITLYAQWVKALGTPTGIAVDLGLPSGLKWATCNVGANQPEEYGDYFAWGETQTKSTYDWSNYKWYNGSKNTITKYCTNSSLGTEDNKTFLDQEDDAASVNWGGSWRMPTKAEQYELRNNCTWTWTTQNGVNGFIVTGPNGKSIFFPAAGCHNDNSLNGVGNDGGYWSSSLGTGSLGTGSMDFAYDLIFGSDYVSLDNGSRYSGQSVRPVCQ